MSELLLNKIKNYYRKRENFQIKIKIKKSKLFNLKIK